MRFLSVALAAHGSCGEALFRIPSGKLTTLVRTIYNDSRQFR
ncbi:MAG TPA: hypothetical protein VGN07_07505 [Steroidobacteraceae bacterium]